jgi:signal transduction histidine kinase
MHKVKQSTEALNKVAAGEEMAGRILTFDWSTTPLGPMNQWPQSLRTVVNILLTSRYAMWMAWGPDLTMLYNDSYRPTLGIKHPRALGSPASEVWAEIWPDIGPRIETVLTTGRATYDEGLLLFLERSGFPEETYHTFSYSPLANDQGDLCGMLCVVTEETDRVIGERRVETLRDVASALAGANTEDEVLKALRGVLSRNKKDLPFTLTYLYGEEGAQLVSSSGISREHPLAVGRIERGSDSHWPAYQSALHPSPRMIQFSSEQQEASPLPTGDWNKPVRQAVVVPIKRQGQELPAGLFITGTNPYRRFDKLYSGFIDLLSGQIAAALGNARAYEAERRRAEALAEVDRAKTTFFSNVSHELRTPLTLMLGPIDQLLSTPGETRAMEERDLLTLVQRNGLRLQKLVNTLLDFSRLEAGRMQAVFEPLDVASFTTDLAANFRSAMDRAGIRFVVDCQNVREPVYIDREMWEKIVLNLLSNALKFTFRGTVQLSLRSSGAHIEMEVEDTGIGIAASELPHIFERFHRVEGAKGRTIEGTGIGLALVQELVKLHGGSISVKSELGKGSSFVVSIPLGNAHLPKEKVRAEAGATPPISGDHERSEAFVDEALRWGFAGADDSGQSILSTPLPGAERILLADDNADMRDYVGRLLGERFHVIAVSDGDKALASALENPPDLILSDVMMPGLDGFGLLAELRKRPETRTIPVILLSARAGEESHVEGLGAGADDYLIKPFSARELLARVSAQLAMKRRREESEKAVKESQATLQSFYDSSPFLMGVAERDGDRIVSIYRNRAAAEFFLVDQQANSPTVDRAWMEYYQRAQTEGSAVRFDYEHPQNSGNRWLSVVVNHLGMGPGHRPRFSFVAEDVTEKRRSEELIRRSNEDLRRANADLEQFAYSASHDLQEPLRQVAIYSQMLDRKYGTKLEPKALEYLGFCVEGAHRMERLITDLLAYSQAGKSVEEPAALVDVNQVLADVRKNLASTIVETGTMFTVSPLPNLRADPVPLTHLFQNLISNAIKYRSERPPEINVSAMVDGDFWRFAVQDNGIGIAAEFRRQVFGLFKRLHDRESYPGTGIGLAICQKIVERLGGRIWVESELGIGSTFLFTLPIEKAQ